ncbi:MAG TPA: hypothetical protein VN812_18520 [Candidatus Acidoferrales bacterium]|nr:hypothetical protein [Candidatus Acidoferrales bacterium]
MSVLAKDPEDTDAPPEQPNSPGLPGRHTDDAMGGFHKIEVPDFEDEDLIIKGR